MEQPANSLKFSFTFIIVLFVTHVSYSQLEYTAVLEMRMMDASGHNLPFWMQNNQRGRISAETSFMSRINSKAIHTWGSASALELGGGLFYEDPQDQLQLDELFISYQNSWLEVVAGVKQKDEHYMGLSSSNENILLSLNARPMPGLQWRTARPLFVLPEQGVGFEAGWGDFFLEKDRYVSKARLHHKYFRVVLENIDFHLKFGLQHYVMWAGKSRTLGHQPATMKDYFRVLMGHSGGEEASKGDRRNALGNNLGSYEVILNTSWKDYRITLLWNSIFEDGSGRRLGNTPDGRYGIFVADSHERYWVRAMMYEFYHTKHQSHTTTGRHKYDNFFNNGVYQSGWTYLEKTIGLPFFTPHHDSPGIGNNIFLAHHLGIGGVAFNLLPFKFLGTYRHNYGISNRNFDMFTIDPAQQIFSGILEVEVPITVEAINLRIQVGNDFASDSKPIWGLGLVAAYGLY